MKVFFSWLDRHQALGVFLLRLFVGFRLVYGVLDNILHWARMLEFRDFLEQSGLPLPLTGAVVSVYGQFIAAVLLIVEWKVRLAAILLVINFTVAWVLVDRFESIESMTPALAMLFCALLFLFQGAGKYALDKK